MKKLTSLVLFSLLVLSFLGPSSYAEEQDYHSHGVTSFYGVYERPEQPEGSHSNSSGSQENQKNGSVKSDGSTTPNYSASGQAIIPKTGDQNFVVIQASGFVVLLTVVLYVLIQKKGENQQ